MVVLGMSIVSFDGALHQTLGARIGALSWTLERAPSGIAWSGPQFH